jgi:REP element-mobilizing transposase RayT
LVDVPRRKSLPHSPPDWVRANEAVFFITICCQPRGVNQLCHDEVAQRILESVAFRHRRGDWWMQICLLMPDHVHLLASFPDKLAGTAEAARTASAPYHGNDATNIGRDATPSRPCGESNAARTASAPYQRPHTMQSVVTAWKHYLATQIGVRWQRDFFDHRLRGEESARDKEDYIWNNPVRAGLATRKEDWPYVWRG